MESKKPRNVKTGAKILIIVLLLTVVGQFVSIYQTRHQLTSPLIPESTIWAINKQFILKAFVSTMSSIVGLIFYFFEKYLLVIILIGLTLVVNRFIYI